MKSLPLPLRVAAGLAVTAMERARDLPSTLAGLPVTVVSQALQASMRLQQQVTELAIRGDEVLAALRPAEENPGWATFDEDIDEDIGEGGEDIATTDLARPSAFDQADTYAARRSAFDRADDPADLPSDDPAAEDRGLLAGDPAVDGRADLAADGPADGRAGLLAGDPTADGRAGLLADDPAADGPAAPLADGPRTGAPQADGSRTDGPKSGDLRADGPLADGRPADDPWAEEERAIAGVPPLSVPNYPELSLPQLRARLRTFTLPELEELLVYERATENRPSFVGMLTRRIATVRDQT